MSTFLEYPKVVYTYNWGRDMFVASYGWVLNHAEQDSASDGNILYAVSFLNEKKQGSTAFIYPNGMHSKATMTTTIKEGRRFLLEVSIAILRDKNILTDNEAGYWLASLASII